MVVNFHQILNFWNFRNSWSAHSFKIVHNNWVKSKFLESQEDRVFHIIVQSVYIFFRVKKANNENFELKIRTVFLLKNFEDFEEIFSQKNLKTVKSFWSLKYSRKSTWEIKLIFRILSMETGILFTCSHVKNFDSKNSQFKSEIFWFLS